MNVLKKSIVLGGCVAALTLGSGQLMAQRNFDPAQMKQDRIDRLREEMKISDDKDWAAIEPLVGKVMDDEMEVMRSRMGAFGRNRRNRPAATAGAGNSSSTTSSDRPRRPSMFGEPSAAVSALQDAVNNNAPKAELKQKLEAVRAEVKASEAKLEADQENLRGVLTTRQEAVAVLSGVLK